MDSRPDDVEHPDRAAGKAPEGGWVCPRSPVSVTLASARGDLPDAHGSWEVGVKRSHGLSLHSLAVAATLMVALVLVCFKP